MCLTKGKSPVAQHGGFGMEQQNWHSLLTPGLLVAALSLLHPPCAYSSSLSPLHYTGCRRGAVLSRSRRAGQGSGLSPFLLRGEECKSKV